MYSASLVPAAVANERVVLDVPYVSTETALSVLLSECQLPESYRNCRAFAAKKASNIPAAATTPSPCIDIRLGRF